MGIFGNKKGPDYYALKRVHEDIARAGHPADCEWQTHFRIQKLKEMGIPAQKLYVGTELAKDGPDHVVTVVGDYYLDNRYPNPMKWGQLERGGYRAYPDYQIPLPAPKLPK